MEMDHTVIIYHPTEVSAPPYTIRYSVYLTCSKKLTGSQLSLPHGINKKLKCETKNNMMSVQSHYHEGSPVGKRSVETY